jgi:hypothetical protein
MSRKTINVDSKTYETLKSFCNQNGILISKLVEKIILEYVQSNKGKK